MRTRIVSTIKQDFNLTLIDFNNEYRCIINLKNVQLLISQVISFSSINDGSFDSLEISCSNSIIECSNASSMSTVTTDHVSFGSR